MITTNANGTLSVDNDEIKKVISVIVGLGNAWKGSMADGKFDWTDAMRFIPIAMEIGPAIQGFADVPIELKAETPEKLVELKQWIHDQMPGLITDAKLDEFVQESFALVLSLWVVINNYFLTPKAPAAPLGVSAV
jgi:hypothetical protein